MALGVGKDVVEGGDELTHVVIPLWDWGHHGWCVLCVCVLEFGGVRFWLSHDDVGGGVGLLTGPRWALKSVDR